MIESEILLQKEKLNLAEYVFAKPENIVFSNEVRNMCEIRNRGGISIGNHNRLYRRVAAGYRCGSRQQKCRGNYNKNNSDGKAYVPVSHAVPSVFLYYTGAIICPQRKIIRQNTL